MFSLEHLNTLRSAEIDKIVTFFQPGARVLEIGAGTGQQALALAKRGIDIAAIEFLIPTMRRHACFRSSITTAGTSPSTMGPSISSSRRTSWSTFRTCTRQTAKSGGSYGRAVIACTSCPPTVGAFGPRSQRFLPHSSTPVRCRPHCCHAGFLDPASSRAWPAPGCRSSTILPHPSSKDAMANAAISSPNFGYFIQVGGGAPFAKTSSKLSAISPWDFSIPGTWLLGPDCPSLDGKSLQRCLEAPAISLR